MGRYLGSVAPKLTDGDKAFIKLLDAGSKKITAFREAYPDHPLVIRWHNSEPGSPDRDAIRIKIAQATKSKLQTKYIRRAMTTYQDSMEKFSELSLEAAMELVQRARSEKVRADLAIEGIRHKIGTPTQKVSVQEQKTVLLTFEMPRDVRREVIDGELGGLNAIDRT